jgi:thiol-disulfide isomerase/thioredoxin
MCRTFHHHNVLHVLGVTIFVAFIFLFVLLEGSLLNLSASNSDRDAAPDFAVSSLKGVHFTNLKLEGNQALLMFWAPWCGVCQRELPKLAHYYQNDMPDDLQLLAIGTSSSRRDVEQYVNGHSETFIFPTAYDAKKVIASDFGIRAFPTYVLLDQDGTILLVHRGGGLLTKQKFHQLTQ